MCYQEFDRRLEVKAFACFFETHVLEINTVILHSEQAQVEGAGCLYNVLFSTTKLMTDHLHPFAVSKV